MVSFSCDHCQNVFTRPRIDRHFLQCRTTSVSCIDCGAVFDAHTVKQHRSCITEAEKYEGKARQSSNSYCAICNLDIPGLVAAELHYQSKKHRAQVRRQKSNNDVEQALKKGVSTEPSLRALGSLKKGILPSPGLKTSESALNVSMVETNIGTSLPKETSSTPEQAASRESKNMKERKLRVKREMKKVLRSTPKHTMRQEKLIHAVAASLQMKSLDELTLLITSLANKSRRFTPGKDIKLIPKSIS